ncbi:glycosyltransferase family 2 protein [Streptomyces enissocaesilis]|uniref:Galactosyltransferase-related protein n=1 Tax=Streptomyces enissocaesilis TaxID=332589 RepID=A0ABP6K4X3_9ACTN
MSHLAPVDPRILAEAVAGCVVIVSDESAAATAPIFWHWARRVVTPVLEELSMLPDSEAREASESLRQDWWSGEAYNRLVRRLLYLAECAQNDVKVLFDRAWEAVGNSRVGYHLGPFYSGQPDEIAVGALLTKARIGTHKKISHDEDWAGGAAALIVVPFRDTTPTKNRLRNVVACLRALRDQSAASTDYRVVVVESDEFPRFHEPLRTLADHYVFAPKAGSFNKSWAVNAGVRNVAGEFDLVCILDGDALPDRDFIRRNLQRFLVPGTQAVLPYRDALFLDEPATGTALRQRLLNGAADADRDHLRGFFVRRNPGLCFWIRTHTFRAIGGMDERFEGWGGEDTDFALRVAANAALDRYGDSILHLYHPPSSTPADGTVPNSHIVKMSWPKDSDFGRLDRFSGSLPAAGTVS